MYQISLNCLKNKGLLLKNPTNTINWKGIRTFLTENYYCFEQWDKYLMSDVVKKVGPVNQFSIAINDKITNKGLVTPLDMDILATKLVHVNNIQELEFIENLFSSFRKTQPALYIRDSMHYSFVRNYMDLNQSDRLLQILKLKYKYGLFLDSYTANMLMDTFIKQNDYKKAALTAHEIMLQENSENELTQAACLLSCLKSIQSGHNYVQMEETKEDTKEKKNKRLVYFLRKEYNDEHFDLKSIQKLNGKTVYFSSSNAKSADQILVNNLKMFGLLHLGNFRKAVDLFEINVVKNSGKIFKFVLDEFKKENQELVASEEKDDSLNYSLDKWTNFEKLVETNLEKHVMNKDLETCIKEVEVYLENVKKSQIPRDIEDQNKLFTKWNNEQEGELEQQLKNFAIDQKKQSILKRLDDLEKQEEILRFFEKRQEIIDSYYGKGFTTEYPSDIPIEPEESIFKAKYERHFKPWPKYMNRPKSSYEISKTRANKLESLKKIYLNENTTTLNESTNKA